MGLRGRELRHRSGDFYFHHNKKAQRDVWIGTEFEERLRRDVPVILKRFVDGASFPELESEFWEWIEPKSDVDMLEKMSVCFERPAFTTPLSCEISFPNFENAISDTIEALNTGMQRLRDGSFVVRIPQRKDLKEPANRAALGEVIDSLIDLRHAYVTLVQAGNFRGSGCRDLTCPTVRLESTAIRQLESMRGKVLRTFETLLASAKKHARALKRLCS